jgi:hypothetical protein
MKKLILFSVSLFFTFPSIQGMESYTQQQKALQAKEYNKKNPYITFMDNFIKLPSDTSCSIINFQYFSELSEQIKRYSGEYNNLIHNLNTTMDPSYLLTAIEYTLDKQAFEYSIKHYMNLSRVCTYFHEVLTPQTIGFLHKHHDLDKKNELWRELMTNSQNSKFKTIAHSKTMPALILICAGATDNTHIDTLLYNITIANNAQHAEILFQHGISPNLKYNKLPIFLMQQP